MSVKFQEEQVRTTTQPFVGGRNETTAHKIGEALTGGEQQKGYLAVRVDTNPHNAITCSHIVQQVYLKQLQSNPLRTKMLTSGSLSALQELISSWLAHDRSKHGHYFSSRIPKMAAYGAFISAPMGHFFVGLLQRVFANRTSLKAKIFQILISNLIVSLPSPRSQPSHHHPLTPHLDLPNPKHSLPRLHGRDRRRSNLAPNPRHHPRRIHARDARLMDHLPHCSRVRSEVPP